MNTTQPRKPLASSEFCSWPSGIHAMRDGRCTRCGAQDVNEKFEAIMDLEQTVRLVNAASAFGFSGKQDWQRANTEQGRKSAQARLFALIDSLTPAEGAAYAAYRINHA